MANKKEAPVAGLSKEEKERKRGVYKETRTALLDHLHSFEQLVHNSHEHVILDLDYTQLLVLIVELEKRPPVTEAMVMRLHQIIEGKS
jgi:hypothetical protein